MAPKPSAGSSGEAGTGSHGPAHAAGDVEDSEIIWGHPKAPLGWVMLKGWTPDSSQILFAGGRQGNIQPLVFCCSKPGGYSHQAEKGTELPGGAICSFPDPSFPLHHCWAMPYTGAWIVLPQKPDKSWGGCPGVRFGDLGAAWMLFLNLRVPSLLVGDPWFDHHTCSGDIHRDVTIPATGRHMPGSKIACNSSQQPMERAACLSSLLFSGFLLPRVSKSQAENKSWDLAAWRFEKQSRPSAVTLSHSAKSTEGDKRIVCIFVLRTFHQGMLRVLLNYFSLAIHFGRYLKIKAGLRFLSLSLEFRCACLGWWIWILQLSQGS